MNKYVILSTDNNPDYYSLLPLVCYSWEKLGYIPVIVWLADKKLLPSFDDACNAKILLHEEKFGIAEGVRASTIAQLGRLFAHEWEFIKDDDILITADADMVIARDIFTHDVSQGQIVSYGFDLTGRSELPICYIKARADKWRELMGEFHIPEKAYSDRWEDYWSVDQQLLTQRARGYGMNRITFVDRGNQNKHGLPTGRWDRFDFSNIPDIIIDVHMPRNDWNAQYQVAERLWPGEDHSFITKFREALEGDKIKSLGADTEALDNLTGAVKEIAEAYNYPAQMLAPAHTASSKVVAAQAELIFLEEGDNFGFLNTTGNWDNHRPLLLLGLSMTSGAVLELGSGEGSTPLLRKACEESNRPFLSYDNNPDWCEKTGSIIALDWDTLVTLLAKKHHGLIFIDHAPGERRHLDAIALANAADVLVLHDTEEGGAGNYMWGKAWPHFKYRLNYNKTGGGAGATMVSNKIDVNRFRGLSLGQFTFDND
jgi:hypothetical protein